MPTQRLDADIIAIAGDHKNPVILTADGEVYMKYRGGTPDKYVFQRLDVQVDAPEEEAEPEIVEEITDSLADSNSEPAENSSADGENGSVDSQIGDSNPD